MADRLGLSWILLTMGDRSDALAAAVRSIPARRPPDEVIVVVNGAPDAPTPPGAAVVRLDTNVGIPEGRNRGAAAASGDVLVFLDDDAAVASHDIPERVAARFAAEPDLAVIGFRIVDPATGATARRHVPGLGSGGAERRRDTTSFLGGACAIRAAAFHDVGGLPGDFFYALEETDLAWRLIDAGWRVTYDGSLQVHHPATEITRHGDAIARTARNRVVLGRRLLPWPLAAAYVLTWLVITLARGRSLATARAHLSGTRAGFSVPVDRRPISWRTVLKLTRLGRPPVV